MYSVEEIDNSYDVHSNVYSLYLVHKTIEKSMCLKLSMLSEKTLYVL